MSSRALTNFFRLALLGNGERVVHFVIVVDFDKVLLLSDDRPSHFARNRLEQILVRGDPRAHHRAIVNVQKNVKNSHHSARILLQLRLK